MKLNRKKYMLVGVDSYFNLYGSRNVTAVRREATKPTFHANLNSAFHFFRQFGIAKAIAVIQIIGN